MADPENDDSSSSSQSNGKWHSATAAVLLAVILYILYQLLPVLELIALAALIAMILRTILRWIERVVRVPWAAVVILAGLVISFGLFLMTVIVPNILSEAQTLLLALPVYLNVLNDRVNQLHQNFSAIPSLTQNVAQLRNFANQLLGSLPLLINQIFDLTLQTFAMLILALYVAYDPETVVRGVLRLIPRRHHPRVNRLLKSSQSRLEHWYS